MNKQYTEAMSRTKAATASQTIANLCYGAFYGAVAAVFTYWLGFTTEEVFFTGMLIWSVTTQFFQMWDNLLHMEAMLGKVFDYVEPKTVRVARSTTIVLSLFTQGLYIAGALCLPAWLMGGLLAAEKIVWVISVRRAARRHPELA